MRIWSVVSQKGGSGKTTIVLHLAVAAVSDGLAVSVIDLDAQKSAEQWSELREARTRTDEPAIVHGTAQNLNGMLDAARKTRTGLVIVDTPPQVDKSMIYAAAVADIVIVPTRTGILDQFSLKDTLDYLMHVNAATKAVVLLNAPSKDAVAKAEIARIAAEFNVPVLRTPLEDHVDLAKSLAAGHGITEGRSVRGKPAAAIREIYRELSEIDKKRMKPKARMSA